jgi:hypothetical protein
MPACLQPMASSPSIQVETSDFSCYSSSPSSWDTAACSSSSITSASSSSSNKCTKFCACSQPTGSELGDRPPLDPLLEAMPYAFEPFLPLDPQMSKESKAIVFFATELGASRNTGETTSFNVPSSLPHFLSWGSSY